MISELIATKTNVTMSFQTYIDNIRAKTGKGPDDFKKLAEEKDLLKPGVKAGEIVAWLKEDFDRIGAPIGPRAFNGYLQVLQGFGSVKLT